MRKKQELFVPSVLLRQLPTRLRPIGWLFHTLPWRDNLWAGVQLRRASIWQPSIPELAWLYAAYALMGEVPPIQHRYHARTPVSHRRPTHLSMGWSRPAMQLASAVEKKFLSSSGEKTEKSTQR